LGLQALLIWGYLLLALPLWAALEVVEARSGKRKEWWPLAIWAVRVVALTGVAWVAWVVTYGGRDFWHDIWQQLKLHYPELLRGYRMTIILTLLSFVLSMMIGGVLALLRTADFRALRFIGTAYVEWFRNTPLLVQLFFLFFAFSKLELPVFGRPDWPDDVHGSLYRRSAAQRPPFDR